MRKLTFSEAHSFVTSHAANACLGDLSTFAMEYLARRVEHETSRLVKAAICEFNRAEGNIVFANANTGGPLDYAVEGTHESRQRIMIKASMELDTAEFNHAYSIRALDTLKTFTRQAAALNIAV